MMPREAGRAINPELKVCSTANIRVLAVTETAADTIKQSLE